MTDIKHRERRVFYNTAWNQDRIDLLKNLWCVQGLSAAACAARLGTTRNAVLSKVHREGFAERVLPVKTSKGVLFRKKRPATQRVPQLSGSSVGPHGTATGTVKLSRKAPEYGSKFALPPERVSPVPLHLRKKLVDISEDQCRNIFGDPATPDHHYCHNKQVPGIPYCSECRTVNLVPVKPRSQDHTTEAKIERAKEHELT